MKASFLIVDDEAGVRSALSGVLRDEGYRVDAVETGEACLDRVSRQSYDVIILDIWLPGQDGLATLEKLRERRINSQVVMISGHGNIESAVRAIKMGAFDLVEKPLSLDKTVLVARNALRQRRLEAENLVLRAHVDRQLVMVGGEPGHGAATGTDRDGCSDQRPRLDLRRKRDRQRAGVTQHPRAQSSVRWAFHRGQLRCDSGGADRE